MPIKQHSKTNIRPPKYVKSVFVVNAYMVRPTNTKRVIKAAINIV